MDMREKMSQNSIVPSSNSKKNGLFIAIEGIDGAGKTTVANLLSEKLKGILSTEIVLTSEPTKGKIGTLLREYLKKEETPKEVDALLFAADRVEHYHSEILPNLNRGNVVITDRYVYSSYAYQSTQGLPLQWLKEINKFVPIPDLVFLLEIPVSMAIERLKNEDRKREEKFEKEIILNKVKNVYDQFSDVSNVFPIDATRSPKEILNDILDIVLEHLSVDIQDL